MTVEPDDLADVIVGVESPIRFHPHWVWHGDLVAELVGYDPLDHNDADTLDFMQALIDTFDAVQRLDRADDTIDYERLRPQLGALLRDGHSIVDAPDILGVGWGDVMRAVTWGNPSVVWLWSPAKWRHVESVAFDGSTLDDCVDALGLPRSKASFDLLRRICAQYGYKPVSEVKRRNDVIRRYLGLYPSERAPQLVARILADTGLAVTVKQVNDTKNNDAVKRSRQAA